MSSITEEAQSAQNVVFGDDGSKTARHTKKPSNRPALQIYKPPGLRSSCSNDNSSATGGVTTGVAPPSISTGCTRPQGSNTTKSPNRQNKSSKDQEENNNVRGTAMTSDHDVGTRSADSSQGQGFQRIKRTESSVSTESALSQKSSGSGSVHGIVGGTVSKDMSASFIGERRIKQSTPPKKESKKKAMTEREMADAAAGLRALRIDSISKEIEEWITSAFTAEDLAETIGSALCQHAIEGGAGRPVAKMCGVLRDSPSAFALYRGLLSSVSQYFDCRDRLRADHFRMWISFLSFVADLYANVGGGKDGELVNFVFQVFDYLLRAPILETLKIEELESLISALLSVGYDLERECPDQLSLLKDLIRDAFIDVSEPWARKMILLLLELGASGWKLPAEANEYYFQQTTN